MGSGMAFDNGSNVAAYVPVAVFWAYPALVWVAYSYRRRRPRLIWLPVIPLIIVFVSFLLD
jgi:hypothetical protein